MVWNNYRFRGSCQEIYRDVPYTLHSAPHSTYSVMTRKLPLVQPTELISILPVTHAFMCVSLCSFFHLYLPPQKYRTAPSLYDQPTPQVPFYPTSYHTYLNLGNHSFVLHLYNFVILRLLYAWNHTIMSNVLLLDFFFTQQNYLEDQDLAYISNLFLFIAG